MGRTVISMTTEPSAGPVAEAARILRATLAEIDDPDDELTASPGMRARIATAAMTLEAVADRYAEVEPSSTE